MSLTPVAQKVLAAVATGAVAYLAWKYLIQSSDERKTEKKVADVANSSCLQPKVKSKHVVLLELYQIELLESLVRKDASIKDISHALRILCRFLTSSKANLDKVFGEIRCLRCSSGESHKREVTVELYDSHVAFLAGMQAKYNMPDLGKALRAALDYVKEDGDENDIFFTPVTSSCDCSSKH